MNNNQRLIFMFAGAMDGFLGALALLAYFGVLPLNVEDWDIPRWVIGLIGAILFFPGMAVFVYFLTRNDS